MGDTKMGGFRVDPPELRAGQAGIQAVNADDRN